jgi:4-hydroxyphenylpyruvate dioxygenase
MGIGDSLIYFVDGYEQPFAARYAALGFVAPRVPDLVPDKGFTVIDHLTNNVHKGTMQRWADFYKTSSASPRCATSTSAARRRA